MAQAPMMLLAFKMTGYDLDGDIKDIIVKTMATHPAKKEYYWKKCDKKGYGYQAFGNKDDGNKEYGKKGYGWKEYNKQDDYTRGYMKVGYDYSNRGNEDGCMNYVKKGYDARGYGWATRMCCLLYTSPSPRDSTSS
eukprot:3219209-Prorocentrum_lima.AAC.1